MSNITLAEVVSFWREAGPERWFRKDEGFDLTIRSRFLAIHEAAARGELAAMEESPEGALAFVILLDQFPRNMFRGSAHAFATDPLARAVANRALARELRPSDRRNDAAGFLSTFHAFRAVGRSGSLRSAPRGIGRYGAIEICGDPSRYRREIRTVSASKPRDGPRYDASRTGVSGRWRIRWVALCRFREFRRVNHFSCPYARQARADPPSSVSRPTRSSRAALPRDVAISFSQIPVRRERWCGRRRW